MPMWRIPLSSPKRPDAFAFLWHVGARILETLGAEEKALRWLYRAMQHKPEQRMLHLHATRLCLKKGWLDKALIHWKKACGDEGRAGLLYWLKRMNERAFNTARLIEKTGTYGSCDEGDLSPKTGGANELTLTEIGIKLLEANQAEHALALFKEVMDSRGATPELYLNMGLAASKMGRHEEALEYYQRAQAGGLNNAEVMNNKGYSLYHLGRYEEAIACYELAKEMCPGDTTILANLASCYHRARLYAKAISYYEVIIQRYKADATTYNNYALLLEELDKNDEALQLFDKALSLEPHNPLILLNKAACLVKLHRHEEAMAICKKMLQENPALFLAWGLQGNILNELGRAAEAAQCYRHALGL